MSHSDPTGKTSTPFSTPAAGRQIRVDGRTPGRSRSEFRERSSRIEEMVRGALEIVGARDLQTLLRNVTDAARELTGARIGTSGLSYIDGNFRQCAVSRSSDYPECPSPELFTVQLGAIYPELLRNSGSICLSSGELATHPQCKGLPDGNLPLRGILGASLIDASGSVCGLIMVSDKADGSEFTPEDENLLIQLSSLSSMTIRHISARDEAEKNRRHLETVLENIDEGAFAVDTEGRLISINPAAMRIFEIDSFEASDGEVIRFFERFAMREENGRLLDKPEYPCLRVLQGEQIFEQCIHMTDKSGRRSFVAQFGGIPVRDAGGDITLAVFSVRDITRERHIKETLRNTRDRLNTILSSIKDGFAVFDREWRYTYVNESAARLLNKTADQLIGRVIWDVFPELRHSVFQTEFERGMNEKQPMHFEAFYKTESRWFDCRCYPSTDGLTVLFTDNTNRRQAEEKLREINTTLEKRVKERTAQLESLNTDLKRRTVQLQELALKLSEAEDKERRRLAEMLHDDLQQLLAAAKLQLGQLSELAGGNEKILQVLALVDRILSESVRKTRNLSHELSPMVLSQQGLSAALQWLGKQMNIRHGLSVEIVAEADAETSSAPLRTFLYKAVNEILFNVVKHSGVNSARVNVQRTSAGIEVAVSDTGKGFDPEKSGMEKGFGLFSIQERIQMLDGQMRIESAPGKGTCIFLQVAEPGTGKTYERSRTGDKLKAFYSPDSGSLPPDSARKTIRVMVVDDHRMMRNGLTALLSKQPEIRIVAEAENGRQAVEKAKKYLPEVILMDVSMPVMNGIEATRLIKEYLPETRVIALSMYDEPDIHVAMIQAGAATYLNKTGPSETLLSVIRDNPSGVSV